MFAFTVKLVALVGVYPLASIILTAPVTSAKDAGLQLEIKKVYCDIEALQAANPNEPLIVPDYCEYTPEEPSGPEASENPKLILLTPFVKPTNPNLDPLPSLIMPDLFKPAIDHGTTAEEPPALVATVIPLVVTLGVGGLIIAVDALYFNWGILHRIINVLRRFL